MHESISKPVGVFSAHVVDTLVCDFELSRRTAIAYVLHYPETVQEYFRLLSEAYPTEASQKGAHANRFEDDRWLLARVAARNIVHRVVGSHTTWTKDDFTKFMSRTEATRAASVMKASKP